MNKIQGKFCPKCGTINPQTRVTCINCGRILPVNKSKKFNTEENKINRKLSLIVISVVSLIVLLLISYGLIHNGNLHGLQSSLTRLELRYYDKHNALIKKQYIGLRNYPYNKDNNVPSKLEKILVYPNENSLKKATISSFDKNYQAYSNRRGIVVDGHQHKKLKLAPGPVWLTGRVKLNNGKYYIDYDKVQNSTGTGKCRVSNNPQISYFSVSHFER